MYRLLANKLRRFRLSDVRRISNGTGNVQVPEYADVVVIGGGSAGCSALYYLGKRGIKAVLLDRSKLISGTTWHTAGLIWSIRGQSDIEMELLAETKRMLNSLEAETGIDPGWINNGGLYIARSAERLDEYKRLVTASKVFGIDARLVSPEEAKELFPLVNEGAFKGAIYSPADGAVDPAMLINALTKSARNHGCTIVEDCAVTKIVTGKTDTGYKEIQGVETPYGTIKTNIVLNACGAWSRKIAKMVGCDIPLVPMKHAYVVSEPMDGIQSLPNIRDPDISLYFRIRGGCMSIGGYEQNPILLDSAPEDFSFSLYELDWDIFNAHMESMVQLIPKLAETGIRSTVCGPESFTPDHKPVMGEEPRCTGMFYSCGYNSAGMMLGGGCAEQIVDWIINARPRKYMHSYDIRRFIPEQSSNLSWAKERSHEAYAKNYSIVFPREEPLSGRNLKTDPFHELFLEEGAIMEDRQGWERPGWFFPTKKVQVVPYDYYGYYGVPKTQKDEYRAQLEKEYSFQFSPYDDIISKEAVACRTTAALFNLSYFGKYYLCGSDAQKAADYLFTANTKHNFDKTVYTCMLNHNGGVEADCTVSVLAPGSSGIVDPIFKDKAFYIVAGGMSSYQTWVHMNRVIYERKFDVSMHDVTDQIGVLSIQGPDSWKILEQVIDGGFPKNSLEFSTTKLVRVAGKVVRLIRISFVGEFGFELHIPRSSCEEVCSVLMECGKAHAMRLAGYRALYSLSCEKGYHLWGSDLRTDDNPLEAGLGFVCRAAEDDDYLGKPAVNCLRKSGVTKRLVHFHLNSQVPIWGLEAIYRDDRLVGYLRRAERAYTLDCVIGRGYVKHPDGQNVTKGFLESGSYQIEIMGTRYPAEMYLRSPFDPDNKRLLGTYEIRSKL